MSVTVAPATTMQPVL